MTVGQGIRVIRIVVHRKAAAWQHALSLDASEAHGRSASDLMKRQKRRLGFPGGAAGTCAVADMHQNR